MIESKKNLETSTNERIEESKVPVINFHSFKDTVIMATVKKNDKLLQIAEVQFKLL